MTSSPAEGAMHSPAPPATDNAAEVASPPEKAALPRELPRAPATIISPAPPAIATPDPEALAMAARPLVLVVHAFGGSPEKFWYPWLASSLESRCDVQLLRTRGSPGEVLTTYWSESTLSS